MNSAKQIAMAQLQVTAPQTITWFLVFVALSCFTPIVLPNRSLSSVFRHNYCSDHLIKININQCMNGQCESNSNGATTNDRTTRFTIIGETEKKCIQYIDSDNNWTKYALKVITQEGKLDKLVFQNHSCKTTTDDNFLFKEKRPKGYVVYTPIVNSTMCVGVTKECSVNLALISPGNINKDRRCRFQELY